MSSYAPRKTLEQIYKSYVRSQLEYGDIIFYQPPNANDPLLFVLNEKINDLEKVQYRAAIAVSGAWKGTSRSKLYCELGWETLSQRRWLRRMCLFYKIVNGTTPSFLQSLITFPGPPHQ